MAEFVDAQTVKLHQPWFGADQQGLNARIGDPWWTDAHTLWHEDFFVAGPYQVASALETMFDIQIPISGMTMYAAAFALSIFGSSGFSPAIEVTTESLSDLIGTSGAQLQDQDFTLDINLRAVDYHTVQWDAGTIKFSGGSTQDINATGSPKELAEGLWYVYKIITSSILSFAARADFLTAVGDDRVLLGQIVVGAETGEFPSIHIRGDIHGPTVSISSLAVNELSVITQNVGSLRGGTITGSHIRTSESGKRVEISGVNTIDFYNDGGVKVGDLDVDGRRGSE